jgi:hypothetical protein
MKLKVILIATSCVGLFACVSAYHEPTSGALAKLVSLNFRTYLYSNERCDNATRVQANIFGEFTPPTVNIPADRRVYLASALDTRGLLISELCIAAGSFAPQPGVTYEVKFQSQPKSCSLNVTRVNDGGSKSEEPSYRPFRATTKCIDNY